MLPTSFLPSILLLAAVVSANTPAESGSKRQASNGQSGAEKKTSGSQKDMVNFPVVKVGDMNSSLKYFPDEITVEPGNMVQFQFYPKVR